MKESLLHNMSAPPRSQVVVAPNKTQPDFWQISLDALPPPSSIFEEDLAQRMGFSSPQMLIEAVEKELLLFRTPPIVLVAKKATQKKLHVNKLLCVGILAKSIGNLYMERRPVRLDPMNLGKTIFFPTQSLKSKG